MKTPVLLLRASETGLEAWQLQAQGLRCEARFEPGAQQAFCAWLGTVPAPQHLRLLLDFADEGFETESLPHTRGRDRQALIARRLASHFGDSPVSWSRSLGRDPAAPHLEHLQLYGLTRPALLSPWLETCRSAGACLDAVCPAALLLEQLAPRALQLREECLLVSFGRSGMRLSHFRDGRLRFSRLVPGLQGTDEDTRWIDEIRRTRNYLSAQHGAAALPAIVLAARTDLDPVGPDDALQFRDPAMLGKAVLPAAQQNDTDAALLHALQHAPRTLHCRHAGQADTMPGRLPLAVSATTVVLTLICLTTAALRWAEAATLDQELARLESRKVALHRELAQIEAARPPLPTTPDGLMEILGRIEREQQARVDTAAVFRIVSTALESTPGIDLLRLSWQAARSEQASARTAVALQMHLPASPELPTPANRISSLLAHLQQHGIRALQHQAKRAGPDAQDEGLDLRFEFEPGGRP